MIQEIRKRKNNISIFILLYVCLHIVMGRRIVQYELKRNFAIPYEEKRYVFITKNISSLKNVVVTSKKKEKVEKTKVMGKKLNEFFEKNKVRPERKIECYELNIRNDKKFPKYAKKPAAPISNLFYFSPFRNITDYFEPVDYDIKNRLRTEGFQFDEEKKKSNIFPSLNEIIENGDPSKNIHYYQRKKLKSLLYGDPLKFVKTKKIVEKYNKKAPLEKQINYEDFSCDIYYVHSDGTIMNIEENRPPYDKKLEESERYKEPRFIITAKPGHAKEKNLKIGDKFPIINEEEKKKIFDNHFAKPKKIRDPLVLPDGRKIP